MSGYLPEAFYARIGVFPDSSLKRFGDWESGCAVNPGHGPLVYEPIVKKPEAH
jgi:hypothetical protein